MDGNKNTKLLYLLTEDWFFCSHFIERAVAAQRAGYDVVVMTRLGRHVDAIKERGLRVIPFNLDRGSTNPFKELQVIADVIAAYRKERPDFVHHVALKPVLYGSLAAKLARVKAVVNAPVGMGYIFISPCFKARLLRLPVKLWLKFFLNPSNSCVIFENKDDLRGLVMGGYVHAKDAVLIRGAGIDLQAFAPTPEPEGVPTVTLTARMLWDKGIGEYVEAAREVARKGVKARFLLVGDPDPLNHASISQETLEEWNREGVVEWLGHRSDIASVLRASNIVCLPSYREGLPKSLLEALSCGRAIVTTDVHGCRETVVHGVNGLLVPERNAQALASALIELINDPVRRGQMGKAGRLLAEQEFSQERVIAETLTAYEHLLKKKASN